jgi:hypothetical protein
MYEQHTQHSDCCQLFTKDRYVIVATSPICDCCHLSRPCCGCHLYHPVIVATPAVL